MSHSAASPGAESFRSPSPASDDSADGTPHTPLQQPSLGRVGALVMSATRARGSPRVGPHSTQRRSHMPPRRSAPARKKLKADDVWTFFKAVDGHNECIFCQYVRDCLSHLVLISNIFLTVRQEHTGNSRIKVQPFKKTTGTTVLRNHLANEHIENWVETCDKFKISITAQVAQKAVNAYRQQRGQPQESADGSEGPVPHVHEYSCEAFVDPIVEWIVADDQVSPFMFLNYSMI